MTIDGKDEPFQLLSNFELRNNVENEIMGSFDIDLAQIVSLIVPGSPHIVRDRLLKATNSDCYMNL